VRRFLGFDLDNVFTDEELDRAGMASRAGLKTAVEIEARLQKRKEDIEYRTKLLNHHLEEQ
jgi:hypothetical protein